MLFFFVKYEMYNICLYVNKLVVFNVVDYAYTKKPHTTHIQTFPHSIDTVGTHVHCDSETTRTQTAFYIQLPWSL